MLSIIILSSDGYSDCWIPFFTLFKKNFPDIENYELILSSNVKTYSHPGLKILSLTHGKDAAWSKRLKASLDKATNEVVMVLVEDFFLLSKMNNKIFEILLKLIKTKEEIGHIRLNYNISKVKTKKSEFELLDEIVPKSKHRFLFLPGLWKKKVLHKYVVGFETPYMAEKMGNYRSWILKDGFYAISNKYINENGKLYVCGTSGAIVKGKWEKWVPQVLEEHNIKIDYKLRGIRTLESKKKEKTNVKLSFLKTPLLTLSSILVTVRLFFKQ